MALPMINAVGNGDATRLTKDAPARMVQLDILRGLAILLVIGRHTPFDVPSTGIFVPIATFLHRFGWTGVDLFFVLSGFLIGGLLFNEIRKSGKLDLKRFFIRRSFKILPSYYLLVIFAFLLEIVRTHGELGTAGRIMFPNLVNLQNYWPGERPIGQTWSLAVEEHFYLLLPVFIVTVLLFQSKKNANLPLVPCGASLVIICCLIYRCVANGHRPFNTQTHLIETHLRIDSLFFGVLVAYIYHFFPKQLFIISQHRKVLFLLGILIVSPMFFLNIETTPFVWTFGYTLLYLGYGSILVAMLYIPVGASKAGRIIVSIPLRVLAWIGTYSYTIYLWMGMFAERPTVALFHHLPDFPAAALWPISTVVDIVLAVTAGVIMGKVVDKPALALRDRFFPGRATALSDTTAPVHLPVGTVHAKDMA